LLLLLLFLLLLLLLLLLLFLLLLVLLDGSSGLPCFQTFLIDLHEFIDSIPIPPKIFRRQVIQMLDQRWLRPLRVLVVFDTTSRGMAGGQGGGRGEARGRGGGITRINCCRGLYFLPV